MYVLQLHSLNTVVGLTATDTLMVGSVKCYKYVLYYNFPGRLLIILKLAYKVSTITNEFEAKDEINVPIALSAFRDK